MKYLLLVIWAPIIPVIRKYKSLVRRLLFKNRSIDFLKVCDNESFITLQLS
jgi:hypothetical protein